MGIVKDIIHSRTKKLIEIAIIFKSNVWILFVRGCFVKMLKKSVSDFHISSTWNLMYVLLIDVLSRGGK